MDINDLNKWANLQYFLIHLFRWDNPLQIRFIILHHRNHNNLHLLIPWLQVFLACCSTTIKRCKWKSMAKMAMPAMPTSADITVMCSFCLDWRIGSAVRFSSSARCRWVCGSTGPRCTSRHCKTCNRHSGREPKWFLFVLRRTCCHFPCLEMWWWRRWWWWWWWWWWSPPGEFHFPNAPCVEYASTSTYMYQYLPLKFTILGASMSIRVVQKMVQHGSTLSPGSLDDALWWCHARGA